jgi:hypothetical protein
VTQSETGAYDFVDQRLGTNAKATMIPYPISTNELVSQGFWRDVEFWNKSIVHDVHYPGPGIFESTGIWFPKIYIGINASTGAVSASPSRYVVESAFETRFRIAGKAITNTNNVLMIDAHMPWRVDWLTRGTYDDGWTKPGVTATIRVFAAPAIHRSALRSLTIALRAPPNVADKFVQLASNEGHWQGEIPDTTARDLTVPVCVPAHGYTTVRLRVPETTPIPGNQASGIASQIPRQGGVGISWIALASEIGSPCR